VHNGFSLGRLPGKQLGAGSLKTYIVLSHALALVDAVRFSVSCVKSHCTTEADSASVSGAQTLALGAATDGAAAAQLYVVELIATLDLLLICSPAGARPRWPGLLSRRAPACWLQAATSDKP